MTVFVFYTNATPASVHLSCWGNATFRVRLSDFEGISAGMEGTLLLLEFPPALAET